MQRTIKLPPPLDRERIRNPLLLIVALMVVFCSCHRSAQDSRTDESKAAASSKRSVKTGDQLKRRGDEIVVCGEFFHTTAPVVLWMDPGGYDAYRTTCRFSDCELPTRAESNTKPNRYDSFRGDLDPVLEAKVRADGWTVESLGQQVDLFLIHYDVCSSSRQCFKVLHDIRGLSVHFMLDLDGTIYQTLDVKERARQTGRANERSIGIEIANIGAYPDMTTLEKWYTRGPDDRMRVTFPDWLEDGGIRTPGFVAHPARETPIQGVIQNQPLMQYDFTDAQYESLIKLAATLCQVLPRIKPVAPTDEQGRIRNSVLSDGEFEAFSGILGHYHVSSQKIDPGPAFDWPRLLSGVRSLKE